MVCFDRLKGMRESSILGESTRWRPVLPVFAPPRRPAVRRPAPTRSWYVQVLDATDYRVPHFSGHASYEKSSHRQFNVCILVSSHEQRVAVVPRINE